MRDCDLGADFKARDPYDPEKLHQEAQIYLGEIEKMGEQDEIDYAIVVRANTEVAGFGHPDQVYAARKILNDTYDFVLTSRERSPWIDRAVNQSINVRNIIGYHIDLARDLHDPSIEFDARKAIDVFFPAQDTTRRNDLLVDLAQTGRPAFIEDALREVLNVPAELESKEVDWLLRLNEVSKIDLSPHIIAAMAHYDAPLAILELTAGRSKLPELLQEEAKRQVNLIRWDHLAHDIGYHQLDFTKGLVALFAITKDRTYQDAFAYYMGEEANSEHKIELLSHGAALYPRAPEEIVELLGEVREVDSLRSVDFLNLVRAYANQKRLASAQAAQKRITDPQHLAASWQEIIANGGGGDNIDEAAMAIRGAAGPAEIDEMLGRAATNLLKNDDIPAAHQLVDYFEDPAAKIHVLREIGRVLERQRG